MGVKVEVEPDKCIASGQCVLIAGNVFDQNEDDGIVILKTSEVSADQVEAVRNAEHICPARAIRTIES